MKSKMSWSLLFAVAVAVAWYGWLRQPSGPTKAPTSVLTHSAPALTAGGGTTDKKSLVVVQTGAERMSNAVRCMAYVMDLANKLPKERGSAKPMLMSLGGVLFFNDCLMAKMSNGYITATKNELRWSFSNAVVQVFTNNVPHDLAEQLNNPSLGQAGHQQTMESMHADETRKRQYPEVGLADGFDISLLERNNMHLSVDDQYQRMMQVPKMAGTLNTLKAAFDQAGITDADQSDLKQICLAHCESRTTAYSFYGPQAESSMPEEYKSITESLDKVLTWRLVNMYGLDDASAQALVKALSRVPVTEFSRAGLQPPAFIQ